jgi:glycosyltransferase involved in cell wall biosynthesis
MKKILLIIPYAGVGGIERLAFTLYNYYKKQGYEVKVLKIIKLESDLFNFENDELYLSDKDLCEMNLLKRFYFYLEACFSIRKIVINMGVTHSISFGDMANLFSSLSFTNEFKIGGIHALKSKEFSNENFLNRVFKWSYNTSYNNLNKVVCISKAIKTDLIENCDFTDKDKLKVIYNPHDIHEVLLKSKELISVDEQYIFDKKVIVFLGRFSIQKAIWHLIKAFSKIETNDVNLVFIGDGDEMMTQFLMSLVNKYDLNDNVFFLGRKSNPYKYLVKSDVLALSSYFEGTPNVIVEAIALNIPIVSSNCTAGIVEMMSIVPISVNEGLIYTESGIITPNLFKNTMVIPKDTSIIDEELMMAKALDIVLQSNAFKELLIKNRTILLEKYRLDVVSDLYLENV